MKKMRIAAFVILFLLLSLCDSAFAATINIPSNVRVIEEEAFYGNIAIDDVILPDGVEEIGKLAFAGTGIKKITLPSSLKKIADNAFDPDIEIVAEEGTMAYEWAVLHNYLKIDSVPETPSGEFVFSNGTIQAYIGTHSIIHIPSSIEGSAVTAIANNAFSGNTTVKCLIIPDTVTSIGTLAFDGCTELEVVSSPIVWAVNPDYGYRAFRNCTLKEFYITGDQASIPDSTFNHPEFTTLEKVVLSDTITSIGSSAFAGCKSITSLTTESGVVNFPAGLTSIGSSAFQGCTGLTGITFPYGLETIGSSAFYGCTGLTSELIIPDTVTSIGTLAFNGCTGLEVVSSPIVWAVNASYSNRAFYNCTLKEFYITGDQASIPDSTFNHPEFTTLEKVVLSDTITSIGSSAFAGCKSITSLTTESGVVNFPAGLTSIGSSAFQGCTGLTGITFPYGLETIGSSAFYGCTGLTSELIIPDTVTSIGTLAFNGCTGLEVVSSPIVWAVNASYSNRAFYNCTLKEFYITGDQASIPDSTFNHPEFTTLEKVVLSDTITSIGSSAFAGCKSITSLTTESGVVNFPAGLTSIGSSAFKECTGLTGITFPYGLETIGSSAFYGCTGLTSELIIPDTVTSIGTLAFNGCTGLEVVSSPIVWAVNASYSNRAFYNCTLKEFYITGDQASIPDSTFSHPEFSTLQALTIPSSINSIGRNAFTGCNSLKAIYCDPDSTAWTWFSDNDFGDALIECTEFPSGCYASQVIVSPANADIEVNSIVHFTAEVLPENEDDDSISWAVVNGTGTGYINQHGTFIALTAGTVTVKAIANDGSGIFGKAEVNCVAEQEGVHRLEISRTEWNILNGIEAVEQLKLQASDQWTLSGTPDWMTVSQTEGTGDTVLTIYVQENTGDVRNATLTFESAGLVRTLSIQQAAKPQVNCAVTDIQVPSTSVSTGDAVTFTVSVTNADEIVLIADNTEYDHYPVTGPVMKVSRKFSLRGNREISFRPYLDGEAGLAGIPVLLTIEAEDPPTTPVIHLPEQAYVWQNAEIGWDSFDYADQYTLIVSKDGEEYVHKTFKKDEFEYDEPTYLIRGSILNKVGDYNLLLLTSGAGWNQTETSAVLSVTRPLATFSGTMTKTTYGAGENPTISIQNPDGYHIAIRISDENGNVMYLPENGDTMNDTAVDALSFDPLSSSTHSAVILSWPTDERGSDENAWCQSDPISFTVNRPVVKLFIIPDVIRNNFLISDCTSLTSRAEWNATRVTFTLDDTPITVYDQDRNPVTEITTFKTENINNKAVRTFTCFIDPPSEGFHKYKAYAYNENGLCAEGGYNFYAVTPAEAEGEVRWLSENDVSLFSTPVSGAKTKLNITDKVTVLGTYGNNLTYVSCGKTMGFVNTDKLTPIQPVDWSTYRLTTVENGSEPIVSYLGGYTISLQWTLNGELPAGASYSVRAVNINSNKVITLSENCKEKKIRLQPEKFGEGTWRVFVTVEREDNLPAGSPKIPAQYKNAKQMCEFSRGVVIQKDAAAYMKYMVNLDESHNSCDFYQDRILTCATILMNYHQLFTTGYTDTDGVFHKPVELEKITDNYLFNAYGAILGDASTNLNLDGAVSKLYMINSTMNSLSPVKESDGIMIPVSFINQFCDFAQDWYDAHSAPLDIISSTVNLLASGGETSTSSASLLAKLNAEFSSELYDTLGDAQFVVSAVTTVKDYIVALVQAINRAYCYSMVDDEELDRIADNLISSGNSDLVEIGNALKELKDKRYIAYYAVCQFAIEAQNASQAMARSSLFYIMSSNPGTAVIAASIQGAVAVNNIVLATDEIQETAHQTKWAIDTAESYSTTLSKSMDAFRKNPVTGYNDLLNACRTMLVLVHSEMKGFAAMCEAVDSGLWTKIRYVFTRTDSYKITAQKATDYMPTLESDFSSAFGDYRSVCLTQLNVQDYLQWSDPLK